jgi:glycosyltransferase involved in cell wall biosynthesis
VTSTTIVDRLGAMDMPPTFVSAVVCTRNRHSSVGQSIRAILANDYTPFELVVIDQSTTDETGVILRAIAAEDSRLRYVHVEQAGLSRAYNTGIRSTTGEILVFTDDDCLVPANWIRTIIAAFHAEPEADLLYGQVVPLPTEGAEAHLTPSLNINYPERLSKADGFRVFGMGANFAARRRLFDTVGYFDEILGGGGELKSSQDFDLAYRTYKAGRVTLLRPEVTLHHDGRREQEDWPALLRNYGVGDGGFYTKHARCRDPYALMLLIRRLSGVTAKATAKTVMRRGEANWPYVRGFVSGVRGSFRFGVDRQAKIYRAV